MILQCFVRLCFVFGACQCFERSTPQTLTGTKKTKKTTTRCTKPSQAPKKNKKTKSQHLLTILDPPCLPMFCEIVLCFFCFFVPANVFRASLQNKMQKNAPRFQSHQMQKTSVFTMFCVHFHSKITSMVPRSQKKWVTTFVVLGGVVQIYAQHVSVYIPRFHLK